MEYKTHNNEILLCTARFQLEKEDDPAFGALFTFQGFVMVFGRPDIFAPASLLSRFWGRFRARWAMAVATMGKMKACE